VTGRTSSARGSFTSYEPSRTGSYAPARAGTTSTPTRGTSMEHLSARPPLLTRCRDSEAGEGVISAAIAVLVMAFIGVAMWAAFSGSFQKAATRVDDQIEQIGH
jgi:hypothetical protein